MTDYTELKRLAEAAPSGPWIAENDSLYFKDDGYTRHLLDADAGHDVEDEAYYAALKFIAAANPAAVRALLDDLDQARNGMKYACGIRLKKEIDRLQAENEALRKDSERYRWLRDKSESVHQFYLSTPIWFTGVKFSKENVDITIDAAMSKEPQP